MRSPGAHRVDGRARLPLCFAEARVTLVGLSDPWGLALLLDEGRRHGGDRGGAAAGSGTGDIAGRPGGRVELKLEAPGLCARPCRSPGIWAPWRLLASSLHTPGCHPRLLFVGWILRSSSEIRSAPCLGTLAFVVFGHGLLVVPVTVAVVAGGGTAQQSSGPR